MNIPRSVKKLFPNVNKVKDAKANVKVVVSKKDSIDGKKKQASECAMAKAVCRQFKADGAIIGLGFSYIIKKNTAIRFATPASVQREIISFDRHHDFESGNYNLIKVSESQRLGFKKNKKGIIKPTGKGPNKGKRILHNTGGVRMLNIKES
jgi:hypothetical protein